jgi:hypothetical protein
MKGTRHIQHITHLVVLTFYNELLHNWIGCNSPKAIDMIPMVLLRLDRKDDLH